MARVDVALELKNVDRVNRQVRGLDSKLDGLKGRAGGISGVFGGFSPKLLAAGAAIGVVTVAATALTKAVTASLNRFDDIGKSATRLGTSTEFVQKLGFAAEQSGTSFEKVESAILRAAKNLESPALTENSPAVKSLAALGLNLDYIRSLSPEQQFRTLADAIAGIEDPTRRSAIAQELFGRSGAELIPLLEGGSAGLDKLGREFENTGRLIDEKAIRQGEQFNDTMNVINQTVLAVRDQFVAALLPTLQRLADMFQQKIVPIITRFVIPAVQFFGEAVIKWVDIVIDYWDTLINHWIGVANGFIAGINLIIGALNKVPGVSIEAIGSIGKFSLALDDNSGSADGMTRSIGNAELAVMGLGDVLPPVTTSVDDNADALANASDKAAAYAESLLAATAAQQSLGAVERAMESGDIFGANVTTTQGAALNLLERRLNSSGLSARSTRQRVTSTATSTATTPQQTVTQPDSSPVTAQPTIGIDIAPLLQHGNALSEHLNQLVRHQTDVIRESSYASQSVVREYAVPAGAAALPAASSSNDQPINVQLNLDGRELATTTVRYANERSSRGLLEDLNPGRFEQAARG